LILIGQYDSPFVRRVGVALTLYGLSFEHKPYSTFGDWEKFQDLNPLTRVPTLVIDHRDVLIESHMMLDYLDNIVGETRAMYPMHEPARHLALKVSALAMGCCDKVVSLFYEKRLHEMVSPLWVERCTRQIGAALAALEADRERRTTPYWFGDRISHADIAVACAIRFLSEAHPGLVDMKNLPALAKHAAALEALPAFQKIQQTFIAPT
jgi:glutathione S-transferase